MSSKKIEKKIEKKKDEKSSVDKWIASWPDWERDVAEAGLRKAMSPGAFRSAV